jgi:hypothetical protein
MVVGPSSYDPQYFTLEFTEVVHLGTSSFVQLIPTVNGRRLRSRLLASATTVQIPVTEVLSGTKIYVHFILAQGVLPYTKYRVYLPDDLVRDNIGNSFSSTSLYLTTGPYLLGTQVTTPPPPAIEGVSQGGVIAGALLGTLIPLAL